VITKTAGEPLTRCCRYCYYFAAAGAIWVTLVRAMLELPTFKTALPLEIRGEFTVPLTEVAVRYRCR